MSPTDHDTLAKALETMDAEERQYLIELMDRLSSVAGGKPGFEVVFLGLCHQQKRLLAALTSETDDEACAAARHWVLYHWPEVRKLLSESGR